MTAALFSSDFGFPLEKMREVAPTTPGGEFVLQPSASGAERLILQSPTGSTVVEITPQRVVSQTRYFAAFQAPEEHRLRAEYAARKLRSLLSCWSELGLQYSLVALSVVARWSFDDDESAGGAREFLNSSLPALDRLVGGPFFDMTLRVSKVVEEQWYLNQYLQCYQDRSLILPPNPPAGLQVREWNMPVSEQGVEFRFDFNNKHALYNKDLKWPEMRAFETFSKGFEHLPNAFERTCRPSSSQGV